MWKDQNTRFIFSPGAAAESLPTCSMGSRPCVPSKSWSTREPSSACVSPACRFGTTCGRSAPTIQSAPECSTTYANTATKLSLPGAFLAKIFHARERARAYAEREADCGRNMLVSFAKFDPVSYSWKIPHFLFQGDLATYSQTWPRWGMMVRGECYPLPPWAQDTGATAFGELSGAGIEAAGRELKENGISYLATATAANTAARAATDLTRRSSGPQNRPRGRHLLARGLTAAVIPDGRRVDAGGTSSASRNRPRGRRLP